MTPEMCDAQKIPVNPWQPSPDNPYFSSAAAAAANAAAAAVTNPHNKDLYKNPVNATNMTVIAQRMSGAHAGLLSAPLTSVGTTMGGASSSLSSSSLGAGGSAAQQDMHRSSSRQSHSRSRSHGHGHGRNRSHSREGPKKANATAKDDTKIEPVIEPGLALTARGANPLAVAAAVATATTNPLIMALNNPLLKKVGQPNIPLGISAAGGAMLGSSASSASSSSSSSSASSSTSGDAIPKTVPTAPLLAVNPLAALLSKMKEASAAASKEAVGTQNGDNARLASENGMGGGEQDLADAMQQSNYLHASRASKRIYVGSLPHNADEESVRQFFNNAMIVAQGKDREPGDSVSNVYLNTQKR
ncbi:hypothetical protein RFI_16503 [Reticulomyxa filosa]|uniref:RRM domain-containing protein n=1 Tax=Reticulomyxa filosa TaxID=46433 RepID=X6N4M4_RETFI|nr:hypothetical protein RFI_16503 [Reticulomyxa filosa]|eukprot:ETO20714.1 hypothetical protein RFI_16503 [Reticulomyxa filosa]